MQINFVRGASIGKKDSGVLRLSSSYFDRVKNIGFEDSFALKMNEFFVIESSFNWQDLGVLKNMLKYLIDNKITSSPGPGENYDTVPIISQSKNSLIIVFRQQLIIVHKEDIDSISVSKIVNTELNLQDYKNVS